MTDFMSFIKYEFLFNLSIKLFVLFSMKRPGSGFKLPFCWKYKVILRDGGPIDTGAAVVKNFRRHRCWLHRDVVDGI